MAKHLPVQGKYQLLRKVLKDKKSVAAVCRKAGVSRTIFYRWQKEFRQKPENFLVKPRHWFHQTPPEKEKLVLDLVLNHPEYSSHKISQVLGINHKGKLTLGNHGVQNVLRRFELSKYKERLAFRRTKLAIEKKPLWREKKTLSSRQRLEMIKQVLEKKEKVVTVCREFGVSRVIFYRWLARYKQAPKGFEDQALQSKERKIERYWRQVDPSWEKKILDLVLEHPEWSVPKVTQALPLNAEGRLTVGYYGVQRVLERNNLNTYQRRLTYRESLRPTIVPTPVPAPVVVGKPKIWRLLKAPFATVPKLVASPRTLLLTLFFAFPTLFILKRWIEMLASAPEGTQAGLIFATVSLTFGALFFIYSLKYYFTLILILGFSRQVSGGGIRNGDRNSKGILQRLFAPSGNGWNHNGGGLADQDSASWGKGNIWERIFGNGHSQLGLAGPLRPEASRQAAGGLQPDLSQVKLNRRPHVSIHLALYNEKRVVERLLTACTAMDYENYEVVVVDDSTDETIEILQKWRSHPKVKVIHRESREGYKGGALQVALQNSDPKTEFIIVFDADFLPYPDTITQFLKYFQVTAGGLDFRKASSRQPLASRGEQLASSRQPLAASNSQLDANQLAASGSPIAAVQGYQWHVLNKSENWITRGVRSEYAGSYVIERSGEEALGALKQIAGSVYMIRKDILDRYNWGVSITEDFELTLKLYRDGYKVVYTPYIQTPSECVSTLKRLIRQRMRWAEGHSHNIRKMFWAMVKSPKMTSSEKLEFLYLSPYYLQAAFFLAGTVSWFISEAIFQVRLPFWTSLWGWSLVFTNLFSLPLMNTVGLFLEESEERDYGGILSFIFLTYLIVPFQAYAAAKGFLEKEEGPWFRTPKTGKITDILAPGRFARLISMIFPGRRVGTGMAASLWRSDLFKVFDRGRTSWDMAGRLNPVLNLHLSRKRVRGVANLVIVVLVLISISLTYVSLPLTPTLAYTGTFYFRGTGADDLSDLTNDGRKRMGTESLGTATQSFTLQGSTGSVSYYAQDTAASSLTNPTSTTVTSTPLANTTRYGSQRQLFRDIFGNLIAVLVDSDNDVKAAYLNAADQPWNGGDGVWDTYGTDLADTVTAQNVAGGLDSSGNLHIVYEDTGTTSQGQIEFKSITISRTSGVIQTTGWTIPASTTLDAGANLTNMLRPSLVIDKNNYPAVCWSKQTEVGIPTADSQVRFSRYNGSAWTCETGASCSSCNGSAICDFVRDTAFNSNFQCAIGRMPDAPGTNTYDDALYIIAMQTGTTGLYAYDATWNSVTSNYNAWALISTLSTTVTANSTAAPYDLSVSPAHVPNQDALAGLLVAWADTSNNTTLKILRNKDGGATPTDLSPSPAANFGGSAFSVIASTSANPNIYLFYKNANNTTTGDIVYRRHTNASPSDWDTVDQMFDNSPGNTDIYPNVKDPNLYAGASGNTYNDGGRVDALFYDGTNVKSNYVPAPYKTLTTSAGASAVETTVGTTGWDDLQFATGVLDSGSSVGVGNWTLRACFGADYTADKVVRARWEIVTSDGISACGTGGECGSYVNLSKASGGAGCAENTAVTPPSVITNLNGYRLKLRINYDNDGSDVAPVRYADSNGNNGDTLLTGTLSGTTDNFYILTDNMNKKWTSGDVELPTEGLTSEQRSPSIATDSTGNSIAVWEDSRNSQALGTWSNAGASTYSRYGHTATLLPNNLILAAGTAYTNGGSTIAELYDPTANTWATTGPSTFGRSGHTANLLNNGKVLVVGTAGSNSGQTVAELYDPVLKTFSTTGTSTYARDFHTANLLASGKVLVVGTNIANGGRTIAELYDPATQSWSTTGAMTYARDIHTATLLGSGKVLAVGTSQTNGGQTIPELYDPAANTWSTTGALTYARTAVNLASSLATLLPDGRVLVAGTAASNGGATIPELYDPSAGTWSTLGAATYARADNVTSLLNNGKVLIAGTSVNNGGRSIAELYDPSAQTWSTAPASTYSRYTHTATLLNNGKVLAVGTDTALGNGGQTIPELYTPQTFDIYAQKFNSSGTKQWASDVKVNSDDGNRASSAYNPSNYDHLSPKVKLDSSGNPIIVWQESRNSVFGDDIWAQKLDSTGAKQWPAATTGTWSTTGNMTYGRDQPVTALLANGKVLATGTTNAYVSGGRTIAEVYDPSTNTWATTGPAGYARNGQYLIPLNSGKVLMAGNGTSNAGQTVAELFDPVTNTWATTGPSTYTRSAGSAALLSSGKVLYLGTLTAVGGQTIAELYDPSLNTWATTGTATYNRHDAGPVLLPNGKVFVLGSGIVNGGRSIAELYDPVTQAFSTTGAAIYARASSTSVLLNNGKVLTIGTAVSNAGQSVAELYDPVTNTFSTTGASTYSRSNHTSALLSNGKVLVVGAFAANGGRTIAEVYDPSTNTWATTAPAAYGRYSGFQLGLTLLNNGKVLAVGSGLGGNGLSIAELYLPAGDVQVSNEGSPMNGSGLPRPEKPNNGKGVLGEQRNPVLAIDTSDNAAVAWEDTRHSAIRNWALSFNYNATTYQQTNINLAAAGACNGGGGQSNSCGAIPAMQNFPLRIMGQKLLGTDGSRQWGDDVSATNTNNPEDLGLASTGDFSANPSIAADGTNFIVTWESNGGKPPDGGGNSKNYDIYGQKFDTNGASGWGGTWATTGVMTYARDYNAATLLNNGKVLVIGTSQDNGGLTIAELYDPSIQAWSTTGRMTYARTYHTTILLNSGKVLAVGTNQTNGGQTIPELYDPSTQAFSTTGISAYRRTGHTATLLNSGKVLVVGTAQADSGSLIAELYDPSTQAWAITGTATYDRDLHTATLLSNGKVLVVGTEQDNGGLTIAELYDPSTQGWSTTGRMTYARNTHTATLLNNGKVLAAGTAFTNGGQSIAELYDPSTQAWSTTGRMTYARSYLTAILLNNGKVLAAGTAFTNGGQSIAEIYDPVAQTWSATAPMNNARYAQTAILLSNGKVLMAGAVSGSGQTIPEFYSVDQMISSGKDLADQRYPDVAVDSGSNYIFAWQGRRGSDGGGQYNGGSDRVGGSWNIYGQKTNSSGANQWPNGTAQSWATVGALTYARQYSASTLLNDGKVLAVGTSSGNGGRSIAEIYDSGAQTWSTTGTSTYPRNVSTSTLLPNGKVLVVGTDVVSGGETIPELYDPVAQTFSTTGYLAYRRDFHTATLLGNGKVLVVGTAYSVSGQTVAELYNPATQSWSTTGPLTYSRYDHTATLLSSGKVLVAGTDYSNGGRTIAELYDPALNTFSTTGRAAYARSLYTATLLNNGKVLAVGTSFSNAGNSIAELYDPSTQAWSTTGTSTYLRAFNTATILPNGKVLAVGNNANGGISIPELYDPSTQAWSTTGALTYARYTHMASLLGNGKILIAGTFAVNGGVTIPELYTPEKSEIMMSHDFGMKGDQIYPKLVTSGTNTYAVWQDNRSAISNTITSDYNIFMQSFDPNGVLQWPAAADTAGYESPYAVMDIRADTIYGKIGSQYSGKPSIGGIFTGTGTAPFVLAWEDNRTSGDLMDVFGQSYDTVEQDISKSTSWTAYWDHNLATANLSVNVGIVEWDGTSYVQNGQGTAQTWNVTSDPAGEDSLTWTTGGSPAPPSDNTGNITMRRLIVTFTRTSGAVTIYSDNSSQSYDSRLGTGDVVPEKLLFLGLIIPFLPPAVRWYSRRRKREEIGEIRGIEGNKGYGRI